MYNPNNLILATDSYKVSHYKQYPPRTKTVYSFFESRGGVFTETTFFGLQYLIKKYLLNPVTAQDVQEAEKLFEKHLYPGLFNRVDWYDLVGKPLPIRISAVPEGNSYAPRVPLMTVENTDPQFYWLTNYLETLLVQTWYPTTVCTQSRAMKHIILDHLIKTGTPESIDFKLHDFGFRGSTSLESSAIGGASHLVNFKGTDTMSALMLLADYYDEPCAGFSIPAAEHSTITSWGKTREADAYKNMLDQFPGMVAVVSDSYDLWNAARNIWGDQLRQNVYTHEGQLIIRPDSGHPPTVVVKLLETLGSVFSVRTNQKGYKVLDDKIRIIQGDGIDLQMLTDILTALSASGWSGDNVAYGSGGGLLQKVNRDTCKFAFKCCAIETAQRGWEPVYKSPVDDPSKASRGGKLTSPDMRIVFENGKLLVDDNLTTIRERAKL